MSDQAQVAYCGLVCSVCPGLQQGCVGCHAGGGEATCPQRSCCVEHKLEGCWECAEFPCERGSFGSEEWGGLSIGFLRVVQKLGPEAMIQRVINRLGSPLDYGAYRGRRAEDVEALLLDDEQQT